MIRKYWNWKKIQLLIWWKVWNLKITQFNIEDIFGDRVSKVSTSPEKKTKLNIFSQKNVNISFSHKINFCKPWKEKKIRTKFSSRI